MKKVLIILVVVLAVVFGLAPRWVGGKAQERYQQMVERLSGEGVQVTNANYDRGWFSAHATTELVLPIPSGTNETSPLPNELRFTLDSKVHHGPITSLGGFGLAEIDTQVLFNGEQIFPQNYPASLRTLVAMDGATRTLLDLPAVKLPQQEDRPAIDFRGLSGVVNADAAFDHADSRWESSGATISGGKVERIEIGTLTADTQYDRGVAGLMLGNVKVALTEVTGKGIETDKSFAMNNLLIEANSNAEGQLVAASIRYHVGALSFDGQEFKDADLRISAANLYAPVLAQIQKAVNEIQSQNIPPEMQGTAVMSTLMTQLPLLLESDPILAIENLQIDTPKGHVEGNFKVQSIGLRLEDLQGDMGFLTKLQADARVKLPESLVRMLIAQRTRQQIDRELAMSGQQGDQAPSEEELQQLVDNATEQQIAALIQQGLITRDEQNLASTAHFEQGKLTVNDQELPLPFLPPAQ